MNISEKKEREVKELLDYLDHQDYLEQVYYQEKDESERERFYLDFGI